MAHLIESDQRFSDMDIGPLLQVDQLLHYMSDHDIMTIVMSFIIAAGQFKAKCLRLLDEVQRQRSEIVITKRGKPVAKLVPVAGNPPGFIGSMKGTMERSEERRVGKECRSRWS